jgi:NADPH2:quinone reductase
LSLISLIKQSLTMEANTMRAVEITSYGAPDVLRMGVRPMPVAAEGEVLIRVAASGINRPDVLQRKGHYAPPAGASDLPGLEVAGVIVAGDEAAMAKAGFKLGDRVCALVAGGGYASSALRPWTSACRCRRASATCRRRPCPRPFSRSGAMCLTGGSAARRNLAGAGRQQRHWRDGDQLAKAWGATVIVTAGSDAKCDDCLKLGADHAINYKTQDFAAEVQRITAGEGVNVILDMVAGSYVAREVNAWP